MDGSVGSMRQLSTLMAILLGLEGWIYEGTAAKGRRYCPSYVFGPITLVAMAWLILLICIDENNNASWYSIELLIKSCREIPPPPPCLCL